MSAPRIACLAVGLLLAPACRAASYEQARDVFDSTLSAEQRIDAQVLLVAAGYSRVVPSKYLSPGSYEAIEAFEVDAGFAATGVLNARRLRALAVAAAPSLRAWAFRTIAYPGRSAALWVPVGLGLKAERDGDGLRFREPRGLVLDMVSRAESDIERVHDETLATWRARGATVQADDYAKGDAWFAMAATWADGSGHFVRFHRDGPRTTGFALAWPREAGDLHPERIAAIMSGSLRAALVGEPFPAPPTFVPGRPEPRDR